jgi:hypothetical protein
MLRSLVGLVLAGSAVAAAVAFTAETATGPAQIRISNRQQSRVFVDVGRRGRSPGDQEIITMLLFNRRITLKPIGRQDLLCTYTSGIQRSCRGTIFLPRGKLVVGGSINNRNLYELAVLGGTGLYDNARGTLTATRITRKPRREFLLFRLTG